MTDWCVGLTLTQGVARSGLSTDQVWLGYVGVGGRAGETEVEAYVAGALVPTTVEHDRIAVVLNEAIRDLHPGAGYPVTYWSTEATEPQR